jgi:hypothetical protein
MGSPASRKKWKGPAAYARIGTQMPTCAERENARSVIRTAGPEGKTGTSSRSTPGVMRSMR